MKNIKVKNLFFYGLGGLSWMLSNVLFFGQKWQRYSQSYFNGYENGHEQAVLDIKSGANITLPQGGDVFEVLAPTASSALTLFSNLPYFLISLGGMFIIGREGESKRLRFAQSTSSVLMGSFWYFLLLNNFSLDLGTGKIHFCEDMGQYSGYINGINNITGNPHDPAGEAFAFLGDDYMNYLYATLLMGVIYATTALKTSRLGDNFTLADLCRKMKFTFSFRSKRKRPCCINPNPYWLQR